MAYYQKKRGTTVAVYYYCSRSKKTKTLPRAKTKHLDNASHEEIEKWIKNWESENGIERDRIQRQVLQPNDRLHKLVTTYLHERHAEDHASQDRVAGERSRFERFILPYFVGHMRQKNVRQWHLVGAGFRLWLTENTDLGNRSKKQIIQNLNRFGKHLKNHAVIDSAWTFTVPKNNHRRNERLTPLPRALQPEEVLGAAEALMRKKEPTWALCALLGYFGCLRFEETVVLRFDDFLTGDNAVEASDTYQRLKDVGLGSKLAMQITKACPKNREIGSPKNYSSNGIVTIWSPDAARLIAKIIKEINHPGFIFQNPNDSQKRIFTKNYLRVTYNRTVLPLIQGITPHDLRRASGLFLGRGNHQIQPFLLQEMLRHGDLETTMLYVRRPKSERISVGKQDFDDII